MVSLVSKPYHTGNVGVGTSGPGGLLEVNRLTGSIAVAKFTYNDASGNLLELHHAGINKSFHFSFGGNGSTSLILCETGVSCGFSYSPGGNIGIGTSTPDPASRLTVAGNVTVTGNISAKYQDLAEWVPATYPMLPGTVVIVDPGHPNSVTASFTPYDTRVAGVVSSNPGIVLGEEGASKAKVATTGRVKMLVDATRAPIRMGDLLVTSDREGMAMRSDPVDVAGIKMHRPGTLIGKALEPLAGGDGEILVLLNLQ